MINLVGIIKISKFSSKAYDFEKDGRQIQGVSYKAQLIDEDSPYAPIFKIKKEIWETLNLSSEEVQNSYLKKPVEITVSQIPQIKNSQIVIDQMIVDIKLVK